MIIYSEIPGNNNEVLEDNSPGGDNVEVFILNPAGNNYVPSLPPFQRNLLVSSSA